MKNVSPAPGPSVGLKTSTPVKVSATYWMMASWPTTLENTATLSPTRPPGRNTARLELQLLCVAEAQFHVAEASVAHCHLRPSEHRGDEVDAHNPTRFTCHEDDSGLFLSRAAPEWRAESGSTPACARRQPPAGRWGITSVMCWSMR